MESPRERVCCYDIQECLEKLDDAIIKYGLPDRYKCLVHHQGFIAVCLQEDVLEVAWLAYKQHYGNRAYENNNRHKKLRHIAYRQLARYLFGVVGQTNRYILPSCAVNMIRDTFPPPLNEEVTGFKYHDE